ncbi:AAA family ATPase [Nocardioides sp.]|uniref:AAA family ATPase n=1 Tax=Nocardioides sp. TaxID=35761 RepID=UPI003516384F
MDAVQLVEREAELRALSRALDASVGAPPLVLCAGPPGIGKSALLAAAAVEAVSRGLPVARVAAQELDAEAPFALATRLVLATLEAVDRDPAELLAGPAGLVSPLLDAGRSPLGAGLGEDQGRGIGQGVRFLLAAAAPLVLVVDDLQWADEPSLAALAAAVGDATPGLRVLAATRPEPAGAVGVLLRRLAGLPGVVRLAPQPLSETAVGSLVRQRLEAPAPAFTRRCAQLSGGNPFLVEELVRTYAGTGEPATAEAALRLDELLPDGVLRTVSLRLDRLGEPAWALARALAVLGDGADLAVAASLAGLDLREAEDAADALAGADVVTVADVVRFRHPTVATAVRTTIAPFALGRLHADAARLLADAGAPVEVVAAQLVQTRPGTAAGAGTLLAEAGLHAAAHGDHGTAQRMLARALAERLEPVERWRAEAALALARVATGELSERDAGAVLDEIADAALVGEACRALALRDYLQGAYAAAIDWCDRGLALVEPRRPVATALENIRFAALAFEPTRAGEALRAREAVAAQWQAGEPPASLAATGLLASVLAGAGAPPAAVRRVTAGVPARIADADLVGVTVGTSFSSVALLWSDELDAAEQVLEAATARAHDLGSLTAFAASTQLRANLRLRQGRLTESIEASRLPLDLGRTGWALYRSWTAARLAQAHLEAGEVDLAEHALGDADAEGRMEEAFVAEAAGEIALVRGDAATALARFEHAGAVLERFGVRHPGAVAWQSGAALAALALGDAAAARRHADAAVVVAREVGARRALGRALRVAARVHDDLALAQEAVTVLADSPALLERAHALADLGGALRRAGRPREARGPLREAISLARHSGAAPLLARAEAELQASGGRRVRERASSGLAALTPTERRVAELAAAGRTNAEVAAELQVSVKTVEWHLGHAYRKLGIEARDHLAAALADPSR